MTYPGPHQQGPYQPGPQWVPPPPPREHQQTVRPGRVFIGIGIAIGAHLLTVLASWGLAVLVVQPSGASDYTNDSDRAGFFLMAALIGQVIVFIAALTVGIILTVRKDGGIGLGILIGWAVGLIITPVVGFGVCVSLISGTQL
ncbi:hypothetical protein F4553_000622 [Allocatelliglobosispora scoriae]|uniref:Uncharacterized protein n=1 Tax=Allocatelliglobosispora scoriae TaxID=643052 RepID=A0A841BJN6_9ACTN|nr:hypothetical protein [Allocatelliglobosispora scoriae]MBB5867243.1 hypothetical protein [Allocatelliglobosispora scoriae]